MLEDRGDRKPDWQFDDLVATTVEGGSEATISAPTRISVGVAKAVLISL